VEKEHSKNDKDFTSNDSGNCTERRSDLGVSDKHEHKCARRSNPFSQNHVRVHLLNLIFSPVHVYVYLRDPHACVHVLHQMHAHMILGEGQIKEMHVNMNLREGQI
jgi:hypothetical protein